MSRLPSLKPSEVIRKLRKAGFVFDRHAKGSHEIWYNPNPDEPEPKRVDKRLTP